MPALMQTLQAKYFSQIRIFKNIFYTHNALDDPLNGLACFMLSCRTAYRLLFLSVGQA